MQIAGSTVGINDSAGNPLWKFTEVPSSTTAALYCGTATPSASNYVLKTDGSTLTALNAPGTLGSTSLQFNAANNFIMSLGVSGISLGITSLAISNANITLVAAQYINPLFVMTGTVTGSFTITFPSTAGLWYIATQGTVFSSGTVSIKSAGGSPELWLHSTPTSNVITIITDGTGIIYASYYN